MSSSEAAMPVIWLPHPQHCWTQACHHSAPTPTQQEHCFHIAMEKAALFRRDLLKSIFHFCVCVY